MILNRTLVRNLNLRKAFHMMENKISFETLKFDNLALRTLPIDDVTQNYTREVKNACFSRVNIFSLFFNRKS